jgi:hypothetical protein
LSISPVSVTRGFEKKKGRDLFYTNKTKTPAAEKLPGFQFFGAGNGIRRLKSKRI